MTKPPAADVSFDHLQAFLDKARGHLTIGEIPQIRRAALAAVGNRIAAAPRRGTRQTR
jgi:hypothetical protein